MNRRLSVLVFATVLVPCVAGAEIYRWEDERGGIHFSDQPPPRQAARPREPAPAARRDVVPPPPAPAAPPVPAKAAALPPRQPAGASARSAPSPAPSSPAPAANLATPIPKIRTMLREGRFDALNAMLEELRVAALKDVRREDDLVAAYIAFTVNDRSFEALLDRWVDASPNAYQPYLARAKYLFDMGWFARGGAWASETSDGQFEAMGEYLGRAAKDFRKALERQERIIVPYSMLIWMVDRSEGPDIAERVLRKALEISPASFHVRRSFLQSITPRWGGSYERMAAVIEESGAHVARNKKLSALAGYIAYDQGDLQRIKKNYDAAERLFTEAISHGEFSGYYKERATVRHRQEKHLLALDDINRAIELWPHDSDCYYRRAAILDSLKRLEEALRDVETADLLGPNDENVARLRKRLASEFELAGYRRQQDKALTGAIADYGTAIRANPDSVQAYLRRAKALAQERRLDEALADLERARQADPNEFDVYLTADWVLFQRRDWDAIIGWWDRYLALHPENGRAYVERGGAYHHKGDRASALRDAKRGADLGSVEGRQLYERLSGSAAR